MTHMTQVQIAPGHTVDMSPELYALWADEVRAENGKAPARPNFSLQGGMTATGPEPRRSPPEILAAAKAKLAARQAWQKSPEGQFMAAVSDIEKLIVNMHSEVTRAREARSRSWVGELNHCEQSMARVQMIARQIVERSLDAQIECSIAHKTPAAV